MENQQPNQNNQTQTSPPGDNLRQTPSQQSSISKPKSSFSPLKILIALIIIVLLTSLLAGTYFLGKNSKTGEKACTQEAKLCPDGSYVGRTGPNCEFSACPTSQDQTGNPNLTPGEPKETKVMKTYVSQKLKDIGFSGYTLKYGEDWTETSERDDNIGTAKLTLIKDKYSITIQQGPMGGALCIYKNADLPQGFEGPTSDKRGKAYTDIETSFGSLRRNEESGGIGENGFSFCQKNDQDGSYGSFTSVGAMGYSGPATFDPATLTEMDDIIKSIKTL